MPHRRHPLTTLSCLATPLDNLGPKERRGVIRPVDAMIWLWLAGLIGMFVAGPVFLRIKAITVINRRVK
jgi:hypothetical protein